MELYSQIPPTKTTYNPLNRTRIAHGHTELVPRFVSTNLLKEDLKAPSCVISKPLVQSTQLTNVLMRQRMNRDRTRTVELQQRLASKEQQLRRAKRKITVMHRDNQKLYEKSSRDRRRFQSKEECHLTLKQQVLTLIDENRQLYGKYRTAKTEQHEPVPMSLKMPIEFDQESRRVARLLKQTQKECFAWYTYGQDVKTKYHQLKARCKAHIQHQNTHRCVYIDSG
jgi:hypothetical protein